MEDPVDTNGMRTAKTFEISLKIVKNNFSKEALEVDRKLSLFQNFALDATGLLIAVNKDPV